MTNSPSRRWIEARFARAPTPQQYIDADTDHRDLTAAAVLVPLVERGQGIHVILTRRAAHLREHAGQISFPGGRIEHDDDSCSAAALREAEEEIRLPSQAVLLTGALPRYRTGTGFVVYPVVGFADPSVELVPDPVEVAEIFEIPLAHVLDPGNYQPLTLVLRGRRVNYWALPYQRHYIWGATAAILRDLYHLLRGQCDSVQAPLETP